MDLPPSFPPYTWSDSKYFKQEEFDSPDLIGSGQNMSLDFIKKLNELRSLVDLPLLVNSGFRTQARNDSLPRSVKTSAHMAGEAADLYVAASRDRFKIVHAALSLGFTRIGIGSNFVHVDIDKTKPQEVIWLYG